MSPRVATLPALPADLDAEVRSWDWEPDTDRALRERLCVELIVEAEVARQNIKRFFENVRDIVMLAAAYALGPQVSAILLIISLLEVTTYSYLCTDPATVSLGSNSSSSGSNTFARRFRVNSRAARHRRSVALALLFGADAAGQLPLTMEHRAQLVQLHGFVHMWDAPWAALVAILWFVLVGFAFLGLVWMATWFLGERAPPRKTIMEHVDAYAATLRGLPASSSPRLRVV